MRGRRAKRPYRKRRPLPALLVFIVLGLITGIIWTNAITSANDIEEDIRCHPSATPPPGTTYTVLPRNALDGVPLTPPDRVPVRVLNANGARGQATLTTKALQQLGFTQTAPPRNDRAFPQNIANCHGQIRFGENGASAARTVHLIDPCLELVRDDRRDASVDLSIGTLFNNVQPSSATRKILDTLNTWSAENIGTGHHEQSAAGNGPMIDEQLLEQTGPHHC